MPKCYFCRKRWQGPVNYLAHVGSSFLAVCDKCAAPSDESLKSSEAKP